MQSDTKPKSNPVFKLAIEMGPTVVFFFANAFWGIYAATAALMASVIVALIASWLVSRHLPVMPVVTAIIVLVFGALTLVLHDDTFIKLKPTIINSLFGVALLGGLALGKPLLPIVLDTVMRLTETGWRILTFRWGLFFFFLAALNEVVWRTQTTDFWVSFKLFGTMPITIVFALAQTPLILKHELKDADVEAAPDHW